MFWLTAQFHKINALDEVARLTAQLAKASPLTPTPDLSTKLRAVFCTKKILLAEENAINQKVMLKMLRSLGFVKVEVAPHGAQAVYLVNASETNYDLILMDVSMPVLGGLATTTAQDRGGSGADHCPDGERPEGRPGGVSGKGHERPHPETRQPKRLDHHPDDVVGPNDIPMTLATWREGH
jgi:hypothetical protein